jgi:hypothetical protein
MVTRQRRPNGTPPNPVRSVRVSDEAWSAAQVRAAYEGRTMSEIVALLVSGYAQGQIQLPRVEMVYETAKKASGE